MIGFTFADAIILGEEHIQKSRQKGHYTLEVHCVGGSCGLCTFIDGENKHQQALQFWSSCNCTNISAFYTGLSGRELPEASGCAECFDRERNEERGTSSNRCCSYPQPVSLKYWICRAIVFAPGCKVLVGFKP